MSRLKAPAHQGLLAMDTPESLRETAERCRRLAAQCADLEVRTRLETLAADCDAKLATSRWPDHETGGD
jgi:hypothetical protein